MLYPVVVLDAAWTVSEALRRLAEHGYWSSTDIPEVRQYLDDYVKKIRAIAAQKDAGASELATLSVADAAGRLAQPAENVRVAIRRQEGVTIFWYAREVAYVLDRLNNASRGDKPDGVRSALDLHESTSDRTLQAEEKSVRELEQWDGIVLRGQEPIGIADGVVRAATRDSAIRSSTRSAPRPADRSTNFSLRERKLGGADSLARRTTQFPMDVRESIDIGDFDKSAAEDSAPAPGDAAKSVVREVHAYPLLDAPEQVRTGKKFELVIGLSEKEVAGVKSDGKFVFPAASGESEIAVELNVIAEGFEAPDGWRRTLKVSVDNPTKARAIVSLVALAQDKPVRLTSLLVHFSVGGVVRGMATRNIVVARENVAVPPAYGGGQSWIGGEGTVPRLALAGSAKRPDIELNISKPDGDPTTGRYQCRTDNAHGIEAPKEPLRIDLGSDANTFAKALIVNVRQYSGTALIDQFLQGAGSSVADKLPQKFWDILQEVARKVGDRPVTLQLNSAEPYVPWELALMPAPIDPKRPPYLGAQVVMGRWILGDTAVKSPPRDVITIKAMAVMAGMYKKGLAPLPEALAEAKALIDAYKSLPAIPLDATDEAVLALLEATLNYNFESIGGVDVVHFAGHGEVDPTHPLEAAIYLSNGTPLNPLLFRHSELGRSRAPFVFLNACMVGVGGEFLGGAGGFPGLCLQGGFCGLIGPLWAVNDKIAKTVAIEFYRRALAEPDCSVAEILRDLRSNHKKSDPAASYLAYAYYGNPYLRLSRGATPAASPPS